jgi:beta-aspartyl-peptidase (threonine type)
MTANAQSGNDATLNKDFIIAIHGGAGVRSRDTMTPELEADYRAALRLSLQAGYEVLEAGGDSVSAVEAAIRVMEDSPLFNAGKGSSFNAAGVNELDSSIMNGANLDAGAVAVIQKVKNPITAARRVMEASPHVLIAGDGALEFAKEQGLDIVAPHYFFTEQRWDSLQRRLQQGTEYGKSPRSGDGETVGTFTMPNALDERQDAGLFGTVGAVALDRHGNLAAGTSTGGREGKHPGRVGDSPIIGAGTYAKNSTLAVSSTGLGEYVIRVGGTKTMSDLIEYKGYSLDEATNAVRKIIDDMGGSIGVVAVDAKGNVSMPFSANGMYRGYVRQDGNYVVHIYAE